MLAWVLLCVLIIGLSFALGTHAQSSLFNDGDAILFTPLSTQTTNIIMNGKQSTQTTATFQMSDYLDKGTIHVGNFRVDLATSRPGYNYDLKALGAIPRAIFTQTIKVCAVLDPAMYAQSNGGTASSFDTSKTRQSSAIVLQAQYDAKGQTTSGAGPASRRLLADPLFDENACARDAALCVRKQDISYTKLDPHGRTTHNLEKNVLSALEAFYPPGATRDSIVQRLRDFEKYALKWGRSEDAANLNLATLEPDHDLWTLLGTLNLRDEQLLQQVLATDRKIGSVNDQLDESFKKLNKTVEGLKNLTNVIDKEIRVDIKRNFDFLVGQLNNNSRQVNNQIVGMSEVTQSIANTVSAIGDTLADFSAKTQIEFLDVDDQIGQVNNALYHHLTQEKLKQAVSVMYFSFISTLESSFIPLVTDPGTPPENNGQLKPEDRRILIDTFYAAHTTLNGVVRTLHSYKFEWYFSTNYQIANAQTHLSVRELLKMFSRGYGNCDRPYFASATNAWANNTNDECIAWVEVEHSSCIAPSSQTLYQQTRLDSNICGASVITRTSSYLTTLDAITAYTKVFSCTGNAITSVTIESDSTKMMVVIPYRDTLYCNKTASQQILIPDTMLGTMASVLSVSYVQADTKLKLLIQKKFGRLPGGITYESLPFDYVPPVGNSTYSGAYSPTMCHRATFDVASIETLPVYSIISSSAQPVDKKITRLVTQLDASVKLNYTEGIGLNEIVTFSDNIQLIDPLSHLLPGSSIVVGAVDSSGGLGGRPLTTDAIYIHDIPRSLLDVTGNIYSRSRKPTYYLMPVGTTRTYTLPEFLKLTNDIYDATDNAVGANLFAVPITLDAQGSPVCNVGVGLPTTEALNALTITSKRTCMSPSAFHWKEDATTNSRLGAICDWSDFISTPVMIYNRGANLVNVSTAARTATWIDNSDGFAVSFMYTGTGSLNIVNLASSSFQLAINLDYDSQSIVVIFYQQNITIRTITTLAPAVFDEHKHAILIAFTGVSQPDTLAIFVDGLMYSWKKHGVAIGINRSGSHWIGPRNNITWGVEAVYGMRWPLGAGATAIPMHIIERVRVCSFAVAENHCAPVGGPEKLFFAAPTGAIRGQVICPIGSTLLYRSALLDSEHVGETTPSVVTSELMGDAGEFSLTFWLHVNQVWLEYNGNATSTISVFEIIIGDVTANKLTLKLEITTARKVRFTVIQGSTTFQLSALSYVIPQTTSPSKFTILFDRIKASLYVNTELHDLIFTGFLLARPGAGSIVNSMNAQAAVSMVRFYGRALSALNINSDLMCDTVNAEFYVNPIGYCRVIADDNAIQASLTYCRSPAVCNGHCETFSAVDYAVKSFDNKGNNMCDDGWLPPMCLLPCSHPDPLTGECLTNDILDPAIMSSSVSLVPAGEWCNILKFYQYEVGPENPDTAIRRLTLSPRSFIEQVTVTIPSGQIVTVVDVGATCPTWQLTGDGSTATLVLTNPSSATVPIQLRWQIPDDCSGSRLIQRSLQPYYASYFAVPACGNVTAVISAAVQSADNGFEWVQCTTFNTLNMGSLLNSLTNSSLQATIISTSAEITNIALADTFSVIRGLSEVVSSILRGLGKDTTAFAALANAAAADYAASSASSSAAKQLRDSLVYDRIQLDMTCMKQSCRDAYDGIKSPEWDPTFPSAAPGSGGSGGTTVRPTTAPGVVDATAQYGPSLLGAVYKDMKGVSFEDFMKFSLVVTAAVVTMVGFTATGLVSSYYMYKWCTADAQLRDLAKKKGDVKPTPKKAAQNVDEFDSLIHIRNPMEEDSSKQL